MNTPFTQRVFLIIFVFSVFTSQINAQVFQRNYSITSTAAFHFTESVQQTSDGGYIFQGWYMSPLQKMELVKTTAQGNVSWNKEYGKCLLFAAGSCIGGDDPTAQTMGGCVQQTTPDGGYILCGSLNSTMLLVKTTSTGTVSWAKTYGSSSYGKYVRQTSDLGYICVGYSGNNVYIVKTTSAGALTWDRAYHLSPNYEDEATDVDQINNGDFVVTGYSTQIINPGATADTTTDIFILRLGSDGTLQWANTYGQDSESEEGQSIRKTTDGGYVVAGHTSQTSSTGTNAFLWKFDASNVPAFQFSYKINASALLNIDFGYAAQQTADGGYALFGVTTNFGISSFDNYLLKLNSVGDTVFCKTYKDTATGGSFGYTIWNDGKQLSNGGYLIGGSCILMSGTGLGFKLIKTNTIGESGCSESKVRSARYNFAPAAEPLTPTNLATGSTSNVNLYLKTPTVTEEPVCSVTCTARPGNDTTICQGSGPFALGLVPAAINGTPPYTYAWSPSSGLSATNVANPIYTPTSNATYILTINDNAGCSSSSSITITVSPTPTVEAGPGQTICGGSTVTLAGSFGGSATSATWSGGTGSYNPNSSSLNAVYTPSATEVTAGTVTLTLTTNDPPGSCTAVNDNMVITINTQPTVNAGSNQTICATSTVTLAGSIGGSATSATWSGGTGSFSPNPTTLSAVYTPSATEVTAGTVTLTLTTNDPAGPCPAVSDNLVITINALPTVYAGVDQSICETPTVTLAGSIGGGATSATWSGGTGSYNPNATTLNAVYTPSATEVTAGTVTLTLTTDDPSGPCTAVSDNMVIAIYAQPTVDAGSDQAICAGLTVTLAGIIGGGATSATWSGGTGSYNPNASTLFAVYTPSAGEITIGSVSLTLTTNDPSGPCTEKSDIMVITINQQPTVDAGSNQTICVGSAVSLAGSFGGSAANVTWSGGTGTFNPGVNDPNAIYTPSTTEETAGSVTLTLTTDDPTGPCNAANDNVVITINPLPTVDAGVNQTICANSIVTLAGSIAGGATSATWSGGTGSFNPNASTLNAVYTPSAAEITAGTVTLTLTTNDPSGPCNAASDSVVITINVQPTVNAGSNQTICAGSTVTLAGSFGGVASSATWSGGTGIFNPNATTLNAVYTPSAAEVTAGTVTLILTTDDPSGPCTAVNDNLLITINAQPTVYAGADKNICAGSSVTLEGTTGGASGATWSGGSGTYTPNTTTLNAVYMPSAAEITAGSATLILTASGISPCGNTVDTVKFTILPLPIVNFSGSLPPSCLNAPPLNLNTGTPAGGTYSGIGVTNNTFNPFIAGVGQHQIIYSYTDIHGCNNKDTNTIFVDSLPTVTLGSFSNTCVNDKPIVLSGGLPLGGTFSGTSVSGILFNPDTAGVYTIYYTYTNNANCTNTDSSVITIGPAVTLISDPSDVSNITTVYINLGQVINFTATPGSAGIYNFAIDAVSQQNGTSNTYATNLLQAGQTVYVTLNNACSDSLKINVKPVPNAFIPSSAYPNNLFMPKVDLTIINRWGQEMYNGTDGWNGKYNDQDVSPGTYFYVIKIKGLNGEVTKFTGTVTLIRK